VAARPELADRIDRHLASHEEPCYRMGEVVAGERGVEFS